MVRKFEEFFLVSEVEKQDKDVLAVINERFDGSEKALNLMMHTMHGLVGAVRELYENSVELYDITKRQSAQVDEVRESLSTVAETVQKNLTMTQEEREKHFVGKEPELLASALEKAKEKTFDHVRTTINVATRNQPEGYHAFYQKIFAITGYAVWKDDRKTIRKSDGLEDANGRYSNGTETWLNTLFLKGYKDVMYTVAREMMND